MNSGPKRYLPQDQVEIKIFAFPKYLAVVRSGLRKAAELAGMTEQNVDSVILAMDEALTNVIRHSYGGPCQKQIVVIMRKFSSDAPPAEGLEFIVRDFGRQVDPATIKSRDLDDIRPGGLGVHIIRSVMDEVEYSCPVEGGMQLRMVKLLQNQNTEEPLRPCRE